MDPPGTTMKTLALLSASLLTALPMFLAPPAEDDAARELVGDAKLVHAAVEDYVLAFYEVAPERIRRSVSPDLKKMGYWRAEGESEYGDALHMSFEQALDLASRWNADDQRGANLEHSIELFDVADQTASVKLTADWGIDYLQLSKSAEGRWLIQQVMWQSHPR